MTPINALRLLSLAGLGPLLCAPVLAQESPYFYGGAALGQSRAKFDEQHIIDTVIPTGVTTTSIRSDERGNGYKLFGGYQFNRNFAVEAGYFDLGKFSFSSTTAPAGTIDGNIRVRGLNLDLVGTLPLTERFSALARIGAQHTRTRDEISGTAADAGVGTLQRDGGRHLKLGAGLQYELNRSLFLRGEAERYRVKDATGGRADVNLYAVSLVFPFGREPLPAPRSSRVPDYVAPMPVASSMPVGPPPRALAPAAVAQVELPVGPPVLRRVSFSAESMFTFDQSALRPEGTAALDVFARELEGTQYELITVEGHTDRIGTQAYNQTLSLQRAEAVKAHLVRSGKISPGKISVVGKSEAGPVTRHQDCVGDKASARLIACLQPDRRVEVEVVGRR
jgi:OmpA-OmpF porin, OOP family